MAPHPSSPEIAVTTALRLAGFVDAATAAELTGLVVAQVDQQLAQLESDRRARRRGATDVWWLTPAGHDHNTVLLQAEIDHHGLRPEVDALYRRFRSLNQPFLELCTRWQVRVVDGTEMTNDHTDRAHDAGAIRDLLATHRDVSPIVDQMATLLTRWGGYRGRFEHAVTRVQAGDIDWFARPSVDSYHSVWFELHEDLLATLGIARSQEERH